MAGGYATTETAIRVMYDTLHFCQEVMLGLPSPRAPVAEGYAIIMCIVSHAGEVRHLT